MQTRRIIICRHAESLEDVDNSIYDQLDDLDIPLTGRGRRQAEILGSSLAELLSTSVEARFYTSPGLRNVQTLEIVLPVLPADLKSSVEVEPLIVKQDWGYITADNRPGIEADRYRTGVLRYKFPTGESAAEMIERLTRFRAKITQVQAREDCEIVVLSHGFEFRVLLMIFMHWEEEEFEQYENLRNCEFRILTLQNGVYILDKPLRKHGLPVTRLAR